MLWFCTSYATLQSGKLPVTSRRASQVKNVELKLPTFVFLKAPKFLKYDVIFNESRNV